MHRVNIIFFAFTQTSNVNRTFSYRFLGRFSNSRFLLQPSALKLIGSVIGLPYENGVAYFIGLGKSETIDFIILYKIINNDISSNNYYYMIHFPTWLYRMSHRGFPIETCIKIGNRGGTHPILYNIYLVLPIIQKLGRHEIY